MFGARRAQVKSAVCSLMDVRFFLEKIIFQADQRVSEGRAERRNRRRNKSDGNEEPV